MSGYATLLPEDQLVLVQLMTRARDQRSLRFLTSLVLAIPRGEQRDYAVMLVWGVQRLPKISGGSYGSH